MGMRQARQIPRWFYPLLAMLVVLLFIGGPDDSGNRVNRAIWNSGIRVLFGMAVMVVLFRPIAGRITWPRRFLVVGVRSTSIRRAAPGGSDV